MVPYSLTALIALITGAAAFVSGAFFALLIGLKVMSAYDKLRAVHNGELDTETDEGDEPYPDLTQPHEFDEDDPYADLTLRDVDPDAVYATEDDDFDEERAEARDGAPV